MDRVRRMVRVDQAHRRGYVGSGVTVAVMDTGIGNHIDLQNRVIGFYDCMNGKRQTYDDNGHGTHIAGILGGSGFVGKGRYRGIAPGCSILVIKVLDKRGNGTAQLFVRALDWVLQNRKRYDIRVLNISVGMLVNAREQEQRRLLKKVDEVWNAGIVVVAAAGNNGPKRSSITVPGLSRTVITVGSCDDAERNGSGSMREGYSGRGPTESCVVKPEVVAPGSGIISCGTKGNNYIAKSGTSMATPVVSGAIALLLQKEPHLSPAQIKVRLYETSVDTGQEKQAQGWGRLDVANLLHIP
ncbi:MAG: S8 family peptidase [Lachnospiraceae bacterium]|nr:S8 family peptidase [Lachnospiraceae bacterium]